MSTTTGSANAASTRMRSQKPRSRRSWTLRANISILCNASWKKSESREETVNTSRNRTLMPTFSRSLEQSLHRALALANERHHEYATLEHLLLALIDDQDASAVMRACNVDLDKLRRSLTTYLESELENLITD